MPDNRLRVRKSGVTALPNDLIDRLLSHRDGAAALLFLYLSRHDGAPLEEAKTRLALDDDSFLRAAALLRDIGLVEEADARPAEDPARLSLIRQADPAFSALCGFYEKTAGRLLRRAELAALGEAYDTLRLPAPVLMTLITGLAQGGKLSSGVFLTEARRWAERGLYTLEQAEEYLQSQGRRQEERRTVARLLGLSGRELSPTERKYLDGFLDMGFPPEVIERAYDKTVLNTGALKWPYLHKILENWHKAGLLTLEEIDRGDAPPVAPPERAAGEGLSDYSEKIRRHLANKHKQG